MSKGVCGVCGGIGEMLGMRSLSRNDEVTEMSLCSSCRGSGFETLNRNIERVGEGEAMRKAVAAIEKLPNLSKAVECPGCDELECQECCAHDSTDHGFCCDCGADRTEAMMSAAYDRAKDIRKYGE